VLKEKNIVVDPTLAVYEWILRPLDQPLDAFEPGVNHMTEDLKEIFRNLGMPPEDAAKNKSLLENGKAIVLAMHRAGIPIVAGTDMIIPGYSLYRELELYNEAGLTPLEALQTATITPARIMNRDTQTGTITPGKNADLIITDANPLTKISNIRTITLVIKNGKIYDPSTLHQMIDFKP
jgi:imidazolonepropionase-like amidohydrolase